MYKPHWWQCGSQVDSMNAGGNKRKTKCFCKIGSLNRLNGGDWLLVLSVFLLCFLCACTIAPSYCPDEEGRKLLSDYIYQTGRLPTGNEPETFINGWGFSYALRPYLSSVIGAIGMRTVSCFSFSEMLLLAASRMGSILSITLACVFALKAGLYLFQNRWSVRLYAIVICFLPQAVFLGSYQNNDILQILGYIDKIRSLLNKISKGSFFIYH